VVAKIPGTKDTTEVYIVGGHWDSIVWPDTTIAYTQAPGVDDNATGATATLEMARILTFNPPDKTVIFISFASEELGKYGSNHYASNASASGMNISCMFNYDMIGNYENTNTFYLYNYPGSEMYMDLLATSSEMYTSLIPVIRQQASQGSDSWSFYQQGYCATFAIEYYFSGHYHSISDSLPYVSVPYVSEIIRAGLATLIVCVNYPAQVENIHIQDQGDGSRLAVDWSANSEVDIIGYYVYWGLSSGNYPDSNFVSILTDTLSGLFTDSTYYITVRAIDDDGHLSVISNEFTGWIQIV
jgi:Zn-dependent M28 family amino/carboxypeptidase